MTLVAIPPLAVMPLLGGFAVYTASAPTVAAQAFDATGDGVAFRITPTAAVTLDKAAFRVTAWTSGIVGNDVDVSFQTLNASGLPSGTTVGTVVGVDVTVAGVYEVTGLNAALTALTDYALCIVSKGAVVFSVQVGWNSGGGPNIAQPNAFTNATGTWVRVRAYTMGWPIATGTTGGYAQIPHFLGPASFGIETVAAATNPDGRGNYVKLAYPSELIGAWGGISFGASNVNNTIYLNGGTVGTPTDLASQAMIGNNQADQGAHRIWWLPPTTLAANTDYWITVRAEASSLNFHVATYENDALADCLMGPNIRYATRDNNAGAITVDRTKIAMVFPLISKLDDGAGGGGGDTGGLRRFNAGFN